LLRQTDEVVFCFDGDAAGRRAAWHALEVSLPSLADHKTIRFLFLPAEHDPDSFVREEGPEAFEKRLGEARPLSEFFLDELKGRVDTETAEGRSRLVYEAKPLLKQVSAPTLQLQLLKSLAEMAGMTQEEAGRFTEIRIPRSYSVKPVPERTPERVALALDHNVERELLKCLLADPRLFAELRQDIIDPTHAEGRALGALAALGNAAELTLPLIIESLRGTEHEVLLTRVAGELLGAQIEPADAQVVFRDAVRTIEIARIDAELKALTQKLARGEGNASAVNVLLAKREALRRVGAGSSGVLQ
jgi:DNA primase